MTDDKLLQKINEIHERSNFAKYFNLKYMEAKEGYFKAEIYITEKLLNSWELAMVVRLQQ